MTKPTYSLDGVALDEPARRWYLERATRRRSIPSIRRSTLQLPGTHGELELPGETYGASSVAIVLVVTDRTTGGAAGGPAQAERNLEEITWLLAQPDVNREIRSTIPIAGTDHIRKARVGAATIADPEAINARLTRYRLAAVFPIPGTFWTDAAGEQTTTDAILTNGGTVTLTALAGGNAPITEGTLRIKGPASSGLTLTDVGSSSGLELESALLATEYAYVDLATFTARKSTSSTAWTTGGTDLTGSLDYPIGGPLELTPRANTGSSTPTYQIVAAGAGFTADTTLAVRAERKYL